jgi:hypothetical protein
MFKVDADTLTAYLAFDPVRRGDLEGFDAAVKSAAPRLKRYFHPGTPAGVPGRRFKMIGYGKFYYAATDGTAVEWPAIGIALQKNYMSVYVAPRKNGRSVVDDYAGRLGELRSGPQGNFSFEAFADLDQEIMAELFAETQDLFLNDPSSMAMFDRVA